MGKSRRMLWGCGAVLPILALVAALGIAGSGEFADDGEAFTTLVVFLVGALLISALLLRHLPRVLSEQGVSVDAAGVALVQRPTWWFRGRTLTLPWHEIVTVTARSIGDRSEAGPSPTSVSFHLRHSPPEDMTPTWALHIAAGAGHAHATSASPHPQITVIPDADRREALVGAVGGHRPDLLSGQVPVAPVSGAGGPAGPGGPGAHTGAPGAVGGPGGPDAHAGASGALGGPHAPRHPGGPPHAGGVPHPSAHAGPPPFPAAGTVSTRGWRIFQWFTYVIVVGGGIAPFATVAYQVLGSELLRGEFSTTGLLPFTPLLVPLVIGLVALPLLLVYLPQYWAPQGVTVDRFGISVATEPMWWSRGHRAHIPWADVHHIAVSSRSSGKSYRLMTEVHLHHVDHELRLPMWAALVMGGESKWGVRATRPVLLIDLRAKSPAKDVVSLLRAARGDLFEDARPERNTPRGAVQGASAAGYAGPGAPAAGYAGPGHRVPVAPYWRSLRARRGWFWALGFGVCVYVLTATAIMGALEAERHLERQEYGAFFPPLFWIVVMSLLLSWSIRSAPRCLTHQGVAVDEAGVTLVQDPMLWFAGRTVFLPWSDVYLVRPEKVRSGKSTEHVIRVFLSRPDLLNHVPTWCRLHPREMGLAPATAHRPLTLVTVRPGTGPQGDLVRAFGQARPDLMPSL
ncbi:hypothetical protein DFP74_1966 [Nocardiopsis sp. Huas11]|nr:hypothetical protein DFP74_1966 [Nocardiopsis sp. Huas11]